MHLFSCLEMAVSDHLVMTFGAASFLLYYRIFVFIRYTVRTLAKLELFNSFTVGEKN